MQRTDLFGNIVNNNDSAFVVSGYRIYDAEQKRRTLRNDLPSLYPDLPNKKYDIIYADPPWDYGGKMQFDKSSKKNVNVCWQKDIFISAANFKYPTLKTDEMKPLPAARLRGIGLNCFSKNAPRGGELNPERLKKIPISEISKDDSLLFMWVTNPHLAQGIELGLSWGFDYKTVAFVWDKMNHNPGQYTVSYCELCLVFKKGRIPTPRGSRNEKQLVKAPRGTHSEKPIEVLKSIERMFPTQDKIELFARHKPENWDVWGLDIQEEYEQNYRIALP